MADVPKSGTIPPTGGPKRPEYEPRSRRQRLAYLIEECGEWIADDPSWLPCRLLASLGRVLAAAGKCMRWGYAGFNPELPEEQQETNAAWLRRELASLDIEITQFEIDLRRRRQTDRELGDVRAAMVRVVDDIEQHPADPREANETLDEPAVSRGSS